MATTESARLDETALKQLFLDARTHSAWQDTPVDDAMLREIYELAKQAPTSANGQAMRLVFVKSREAKERLRPSLAPMNVTKAMTAPVTVIVAYDRLFLDQLPKLLPHADARSWFAGLPDGGARARFGRGGLGAGGGPGSGGAGARVGAGSPRGIGGRGAFGLFWGGGGVPGNPGAGAPAGPAPEAPGGPDAWAAAEKKGGPSRRCLG